MPQNILKTLVVLLILTSKICFAQESGTINLSSHTYGNPEGKLSQGQSAGQSKVGLSVDYFTGKIQASMDLGSVGDQFTKIALSYNSGGFKPSTPSGILGLGWNLVCGGAITRQIRGIPDEVSNSFNNDIDSTLPRKLVSPFLNNLRIQNFDPRAPNFKVAPIDVPPNDREAWEPNENRFIEKLAKNEYDTQYDIFSISAPGISGSFYLQAISENQDPKIISIGLNNLIINPSWKRGTVKGFSTPQIIGLESFTITCPDASVYFFTKAVETVIDLQVIKTGTYLHREEQGKSIVIRSENPERTSTKTTYRATWLLEKIETKTLGAIFYKYENVLSTHKSRTRTWISNPRFVGAFNDSAFAGQFPNSLKTTYTTVNENLTPVLSEISTPSGSVKFEYTGSGEFENPQGPDKVLSKIRFFNTSIYSGSISFNYREVGSPTTRLLLSGLEVFDKTENSNGPMMFDYFLGSKGLPLYSNEELDYWGYFNGKSLINFYDNYFGPTATQRSTRGAPDFQVGISGLLKSITYSDKSITEIEYEQNKSFENLKTTTFWEGPAGGYRVSKIVYKQKNLADKVKTYQYGRKDLQSASTPSLCWKGGFPIFSQINMDPNFPAYDIIYSRKFQLGTLILGSTQFDDDTYLAYKYLINYDQVQTTPVYQLEDHLGRTVIYTLVKEINEDNSYSLMEFSEPKFGQEKELRFNVEGDIKRTVGDHGQHSIGKMQDYFDGFIWLNQFKSKWVTNNRPYPFSVGFGFSRNDSLLIPFEFQNSDRLEHRSELSRKMSTSFTGGNIEKIASYRKDNKLLSLSTYTYKDFIYDRIKNISIQSLINYSSYIYSADPLFLEDHKDGHEDGDAVNGFKRRAREWYYGDTYPSTAIMFGFESIYLINPNDEVFGKSKVLNMTTINYDPKLQDNFGLKKEEINDYIEDPQNRRLFGALRSSVVRDYRLSNLNEAYENLTVFRYPSDFLTDDEREYLEASIWNNASYFNSSNLNREVLAFAHLVHGLQEEGPIETYTYSKKPNKTNWQTTGIKVSLQYFWGNLQSPLIGSKFSYIFPLKSKIFRHSSTDFPIGFQPIDWSITDGLKLDPGYEKISEVDEIGLNGQPQTVSSLMKKQNGFYLKGEFSSKIFGYNRSIPIAEISMAKSSECAFTSFEMPITNQHDENGWIVYDGPPNETITTSIVDEGFTGGKSAKVDFSYGPTINIPILDKVNKKDYVFEAWVKKINNSSNLPSKVSLGGYICKESTVGWNSLGAGTGVVFLTNNWQKIRLEIPISNWDLSITGDEHIVLRLYSKSERGSTTDQQQEGFLIDDCRVYPKEALMKNTIIDLDSYSSFQIDAKGKMLQTKVSDDRIEKFDSFGNLKSIQILNSLK